MLYALSFALALLGIYLLFAVFVRFDETISDYFMYCLVCIGMLISAQMLLTYATTVQFANGAVVKESVVLGWGVWTTVGGVQAFLIPACFYFAAEHKRGWIFYLLGLLEALCTVLSQSRGAMLVGGGTLVLCLVAVCFFGKNRKINRIITLCLVVVGIAGVIVLREQVIALLSNFINRGFNDNGRYELWEIGFKQFLSYPIFGSGFYDSGIVQDWHIEVYPYFYHNTVVQILGSTGVIGTLAYLWHRFCTVRLVLHTPSLFKSFLGIGILSLLAFCMLDVLLFITYPLMFYALMLLFMEKSDV